MLSQVSISQRRGSVSEAKLLERREGPAGGCVVCVCVLHRADGLVDGEGGGLDMLPGERRG